MPNKKVGFIDLVKVSRRIWGYDLGWLYWPQWYHFSSSDFKKAKEHFAYLERFHNLVYRFAPLAEKKKKLRFYQKCHLVLLERVIGSMYDLNRKIRHTLKMSAKQKKEMMKFLNELLTLILVKL